MIHAWSGAGWDRAGWGSAGWAKAGGITISCGRDPKSCLCLVPSRVQVVAAITPAPPCWQPSRSSHWKVVASVMRDIEALPCNHVTFSHAIFSIIFSFMDGSFLAPLTCVIQILFDKDVTQELQLR